MLKHKLVLADGTVLTSGTGTEDAIRSITVTWQVNDETDLCPGAACAACAELELWAPENRLRIAPAEEMTLLRQDTDTGAEETVGIFRAEQPVKASANVYRVTAYDRMVLLDKDLSPWLRARQDAFPMALGTLVQEVCDQCGVTLADGAVETLPNADYRVRRFYADGLTGRQLIQWAGQIACRFARMTPEGKLEFAWYTPHGAADTVAPGEDATPTALRLAGAVLRTVHGQVWRFGLVGAPYLQGSLTYQDYRTAPLDKVQIRQSDDDAGVIYPPDETGTNALVLQGNLLLTADSADAIRPVAQYLFETLRTVQYTPLSVRALAADGFLPRAGGTLTVLDAYGRQYEIPLMRCTLAGQTLTLEATGNARRDGVAAVNARKYTNLQGKMLEIRTDIDGLNVKASELAGNYTQLELTVEGISARTEDLEGNYTQLDLDVDGLRTRTEDLAGDYTQMSQRVDGLDLSVVKKGQVRTQFAADADSVTVNSGLVKFTANTLAIESDNFQLTPEGNVTATGTFNSQSGELRSTVRNGGFYSYADGELCAAIYGYTESGQDMGSMRCYGPTNSGGRHEFAVLRAGTGGGEFALTDANGDQNVQILGGVIQARGLGISGTKNRIVPTSFGRIKMHALESPQPRFLDFGTGICGEDGLCLLTLDPRVAETMSRHQPPLWQVTPNAPGAMWVEPGWDATVHGAPGQPFTWSVSAPQIGFEEQYADLWDELPVTGAEGRHVPLPVQEVLP